MNDGYGLLIFAAIWAVLVICFVCCFIESKQKRFVIGFIVFLAPIAAMIYGQRQANLEAIAASERETAAASESSPVTSAPPTPSAIPTIAPPTPKPLPREVTLTSSITIPVAIAGKASGVVTLPRGTRVQLLSAAKDSVVVRYVDSTATIPIASTDFHPTPQ